MLASVAIAPNNSVLTASGPAEKYKASVFQPKISAFQAVSFASKALGFDVSASSLHFASNKSVLGVHFALEPIPVALKYYATPEDSLELTFVLDIMEFDRW
jgi:hypothetical protein